MSKWKPLSSAPLVCGLSLLLLASCQPGDLQSLLGQAPSASPSNLLTEPDSQSRPLVTPSALVRPSQTPGVFPSAFKSPLSLQSPIPVLASPSAVSAILPVLFNTRMPIDFGAKGSLMLGRRYELYAGPTAAFAIDFEFKAPLDDSSENGLIVKSGSGQVLRTVRNSDTVLVNGNVALLELFWNGKGDKPDVKIRGLGKQTFGGGFPAQVTRLADQVKSMPITLNQPIELFSHPANQGQLQFLTVTGVRGKNLDIVMDGPGTAYVNHESRGFYFPDEGQAPDERVDAQNQGFVHIPASQQDTLLLTVQTQGNNKEALHTRLSVNEVRDLVDLTVRFSGQPTEYDLSGPNELQTQMSDIARYASLTLYQVTAGRTRIRSLKILVGALTQPLSKIDVRVDTTTLSGDLVREHTVFTGTPGALIELEKRWWKRYRTLRDHPGYVLAHEIIHQRYGILDEYQSHWKIDEQIQNGAFEPDNLLQSVNYCPNSVMACAVAEFCWQGNHNPTGNATIANLFDNPLTLNVVEKNSSWDLYALAVKVPAPTHHPPLILKDVKANANNTLTTVVLPLNTSMDLGSGKPFF